MSIVFDSTCMECHLRRTLETARTLGTEEQATELAMELCKLYLQAPRDVASPMFGPATGKLLQQMYGITEDRFAQEKADSNRFVLERLDQIRQKVEAAPDPVYAGLQFAILGNYIDFSALQGEVSFEKLDGLLEEAEAMELDRQVYAQLHQDLQKGKKLLFLTDNAGEIGFDRVWAEQIQKAFPQLEITFCVRGALTLNDATRADAQEVGIPFRVIDNGNDIAGTVVELLGDEAKQALEEADVVIAKGQGNTETMYGCGYNVYYAFLVKCVQFIQYFGKEKLTPMLIRDSKV